MIWSDFKFWYKAYQVSIVTGIKFAQIPFVIDHENVTLDISFWAIKADQAHVNARFELAGAFELVIKFNKADLSKSEITSLDRFKGISDDDLEHELMLLKLSVT